MEPSSKRGKTPAPKLYLEVPCRPQLMLIPPTGGHHHPLRSATHVLEQLSDHSVRLPASWIRTYWKRGGRAGSSGSSWASWRACQALQEAQLLATAISRTTAVPAAWHWRRPSPGRRRSRTPWLEHGQSRPPRHGLHGAGNSLVDARTCSWEGS